MQKRLFTDLGLSPELLKAISRIGYEEASPIQSAAIPVLLGGVDVIGQSQTGSGKTAAFAIPAIERVDTSKRVPQALILCPTRELAVQVAEEVARLAFFKKGLRELPIYGGQSYDRQLRGLQQGAQIIIGTPGRVMDHLQRGTLKLGAISTIILDEADRMLDMGFIDDIRSILSGMPEERQTVLFSATLPPAIKQLIKEFTKNPEHVQIEAQSLTVPAIDQVYYEVDRRSKLEVLCRLIDLQDIRFGIIFCATKMMVDDLTEHLGARGYIADKLHGDMTQFARERVMQRFRKRAVEFLVATDVAARGVDVDDIEVVFNYDLPNDGEDYVHRIGRTGRAGRAGRAITLVSGREIWKLQNITRFTKARIRRERVPSLEEVEEKRANVFFENLRETLTKGDYKRHDLLIDRLLEQNFTPTEIASALIHMAQGEKQRPAKGGSEAGSDAPRPSAKHEAERPERSYERKERYNERPERHDERPQRYAKQSRYDSPAPAHYEDEGPRKPRRKEQPIARKGQGGMTRLIFNAGREDEIGPGDLVGVISGAARIPREQIGSIRLMARKSSVDIESTIAPHVLSKLNGITFKGKKLAVTL